MSCKNYVGKTFAHLAGGVGLAAAFSRVPAAETVLAAAGNTQGAKIGLFVFYLVALIGLIFALRKVPVGGPAQYGLALAFVFIVSQTLKPVLERLDQKDQLAHVLTLTTGVFVGMAALAFFGPANFLGFGPFLFVGLIGLILAEVVWAILQATNSVSDKASATGNTVFSWIGVGLFSLYTAYHTQRIKRHAASCRGKGDYINESLSLFLDVTNLFLNFSRLQED